MYIMLLETTKTNIIIVRTSEVGLALTLLDIRYENLWEQVFL